MRRAKRPERIIRTALRIPVKMLVGGLDADVTHEGLCMLHSELFDTYLKKRKERPDIKSCAGITVTEYKPDIH